MEFVDHWLENSLQEQSHASKSQFNGHPVLYLKDWHFVKVRYNLFCQIFCLFDAYVEECLSTSKMSVHCNLFRQNLDLIQYLVNLHIKVTITWLQVAQS